MPGWVMAASLSGHLDCQKKNATRGRVRTDALSTRPLHPPIILLFNAMRTITLQTLKIKNIQAFAIG